MRPFATLSAGLLCALVAACTSVPAPPSTQAPSQSTGGQPTVTVSTPLPGAVLTVGSDVPVSATASDTIGVARVDLTVDGVAVASYTTPVPAGQPSVSAELHWTPTVVGAHALAVTAYRADGTASVPAVIAISVTDATAVASPGTSTSGSSAAPSVPAPPSAVAPPSDPPAPAPTRTRRPRPTATVTDPPAPTEPPEPPDINVYPSDYSVGGGADVDLGSFSQIEVTITNSGTDRARNFEVLAICQGFGQTQTVPGLDPNEQYDLTFRYYHSVPDEGLPSSIFADSTARITESDETDNQVLIEDPTCTRVP